MGLVTDVDRDQHRRQLLDDPGHLQRTRVDRAEAVDLLDQSCHPGPVGLAVGADEHVLVCGDKKADKARVARLVELIPGLRAVNAGPLEMARIVEQLTPMLISVNSRYKAHAGIRLTGLPADDHWS